MKIEINQMFKDNYSYLIIDEKKKLHVLLILVKSKPVIKYIENNNIIKIYSKHSSSL